MIGYRILPQHVGELTSLNQLSLLSFLGKTCGLPVQDVVAVDMLMAEDGRITMEAHVRDRSFSGALGQHVVDVKTFPSLRHEMIPEFLVRQFVAARPVPEGGFGNAPLSPITPSYRSF